MRYIYIFADGWKMSFTRRILAHEIKEYCMLHGDLIDVEILPI